MLGLLGSRRLLPLLLTQFLGALNDNLFKNALLTVIMIKMAENSDVLSNVVAGLFILPFFLFSATGGEFADKYNRAIIACRLKICELILMLLVAVAYVFECIPLLIVILFLMGTQSAFFGPIKYALLPQQLKQEELIAGNAYVEGTTYLAIMGGLLLGTLLPIGVSVGFLIGISVLGLIASKFILSAPAPRPDIKLSANIFKSTGKTLALVKKDSVIWKSVLGATWFWSIGAFIVVQIYPLAAKILNASEQVVTVFLVLFSIGVALGSLCCNKLLKGLLHVTYVPISAVGMTLTFIVLYFLTNNYPTPVEQQTITTFFMSGLNISICVCLFFAAFLGGLYIVPLQAYIQNKAPQKYVASVIAGNNIINSFGMAVIALFAVGCLKIGLTIPQLFLCVGLIGIGVAVYICALLPDALIRSVLHGLLKLFYRIETEGLENYKKAGKRVLLVANHTSLLDALLLVACIPEKLTFAINTEWSKKWYIRCLKPLVNLYALDPANPMAIRSLIEEIKKDKKVIIFPEGRISVTGGLMKIYEGAGIVADKAEAEILPIRINGAQYSCFSYLKHKVKTRLFPQIRLDILLPQRMIVPENVFGRQRRAFISTKLYDLMVNTIYETSHKNLNLFQSLLDAESVNGKNHVILEDIKRKPITYGQMISKSYILGSLYKTRLGDEKYIGLMMPNMSVTILSFFALIGIDKVPAMLNFTLGIPQMLSTLNTVGIKSVISSKLFVRQARLEKTVEAMKEAGVQFLWLEEMQKTVGLGEKVKGVCRALCRPKPKAQGDDTAVVLFTSGSEGMPKAVLLTHKNLQTNRYQISSVVAFNSSDVFFNALPMFHSFGLSVGCIMTLLSGVKTFVYPSPLHYRIIPELVYDINATIICGTDTFLSGYGRLAHPYDFFAVKYAIVGGEKLKTKTADLWSKKFGVRILEGYGATETSPVLSLNTPMYLKEGSVGRLLPGISCEIRPVQGIDEGGELWVKGDNNMQGYMKADDPGVIQPLEDNWYNTGDIVVQDENGFISIRGRAKRFAKIAGEMVSLSSVESLLSQMRPNYIQGVLAVADEKKGEQLVCMTNDADLTVSDIQAYFKENQYSELWVPRKVVYLKDLPLLGTGKFDYQKAKTLLNEMK